MVEQRTFVDERHFLTVEARWTENPFNRSLPLLKKVTPESMFCRATWLRVPVGGNTTAVPKTNLLAA